MIRAIVSGEDDNGYEIVLGQRTSSHRHHARALRKYESGELIRIAAPTAVVYSATAEQFYKTTIQLDVRCDGRNPARCTYDDARVFEAFPCQSLHARLAWLLTKLPNAFNSIAGAHLFETTAFGSAEEVPEFEQFKRAMMASTKANGVHYTETEASVLYGLVRQCAVEIAPPVPIHRGSNDGVSMLFGLMFEPVLALMNHSCTANTVEYWHDGRLYVFAASAIEPGDELTRDYLHNMSTTLDRATRQFVLYNAFHFTCSCILCYADLVPTVDDLATSMVKSSVAALFEGDLRALLIEFGSGKHSLELRYVLTCEPWRLFTAIAHCVQVELEAIGYTNNGDLPEVRRVMNVSNAAYDALSKATPADVNVRRCYMNVLDAILKSPATVRINRGVMLYVQWLRFCLSVRPYVSMLVTSFARTLVMEDGVSPDDHVASLWVSDDVAPMPEWDGSEVRRWLLDSKDTNDSMNDRVHIMLSAKWLYNAFYANTANDANTASTTGLTAVLNAANQLTRLDLSQNNSITNSNSNTTTTTTTDNSTSIHSGNKESMTIDILSTASFKLYPLFNSYLTVYDMVVDAVGDKLRSD